MTLKSDQVAKLAKSNPQKALAEARKISDPWLRSQALSWVARFTDGDPVQVAKQAAKAAVDCDDEFKRTAVRAWEIAALAERDETKAACSALKETLRKVAEVTPLSSRAEALTLLLHAAARIGDKAAKDVAVVLQTQCGTDSHWRCKRALQDCVRVLNKESKPRQFFW